MLRYYVVIRTNFQQINELFALPSLGTLDAPK
jgi:hypothetical protein